jgi:hypothetical protein
VKKRRKLRKRAVCDSQKMWEATRRDAWLRELLMDSSGEDSDGGYSRFKESGKWIAEIGKHLVEAEPVTSEKTSNEDFLKGALGTLDMLDEKVERVGARLEQIETRVKELGERGEGKKKEVCKKRKIREEDSGGPRRCERLGPKQAGGGQVGKGVLMLSILGVFVTRMEAWKTSGGQNEVLQEVMRNMAMGLELAENIALGMEVLRMRAVDRQKQKLYNLTSKVIEDALRKLEHEKATQAELREEAPNCTTTTAELGEFNVREGVALRLQIMGVFTLCGFLATLGWGGMTSILVLTAKVWPMKPVKECRDASTNTGVLGSRGRSRSLKPAEVSLREGRVRWEWPRRATPAGRQIRWMHGPEMATVCEQNRGGCGLEMSTRGRPAEGSVSDTRSRGQPACHEDTKK